MAITSLKDIQLTEQERSSLGTVNQSVETPVKEESTKKGLSPNMRLLKGVSDLGDKTFGAASRALTGLVSAAAKPIGRTLAAPVAAVESLGVGIGSGFKDVKGMNRPFEEGVSLGPLGTYKPVGANEETIEGFTRDIVGTGIEAAATLMPVGKGATVAKGLISRKFLQGLVTGMKYGAPAGGGIEFGASIRDRSGLLETLARTGLGTAGGAVFGGISMGMIPVASRIWKTGPSRASTVAEEGITGLVSPKTKATLSQPIKKVGAMIESSAEKGEKMALMTPAEQKAVGSGLDLDFVSSIFQSAESGNRRAFTEMRNIAESKAGNMFNKELIEQVPGRSILDRAKFNISKRNEAGKKIGDLIESIGTEKTNISNEVLKFKQDIAKFGVQVKNDGVLRNTGRLSEADMKMVQKMYDLIKTNSKGQTIRSVKQVQQIRQRLFDEFDLAKGPTGEPTYTAAVDQIGKKLHSYLINGISQVDSRYGELAKEYAMTSNSLRPLAKIMGYKGKIENITTKDLRAGEISRRMAGNAADNVISAVADLESAAVTLGYKLEDNIYEQVIFASALRRMYGLGQPNAAEGAITQGISQTATDLGRGKFKSTLIKGIDSILSPNKKLQQNALKELLEGSGGTVPKAKGVAPSKASAKKVIDPLVKEAKKYKTSDEFLGTKKINQNSKIVWQSNKEGGQKIGNKQFLRKPTLKDFKEHILPRSSKEFYKGKTIEQQYKEMFIKEPSMTISFVDSGKGWKVNKIDDFESIKKNINTGMEKGWAKVIDDFNSSEAMAVRKSFDSDGTLTDIWKKAKLEGMFKKAPKAKSEIDAVADKVVAGLNARVLKAPIKTLESAEAKLAGRLNGDVTKLNDLARNTILVFDDKSQKAVLSRLKQQGVKSENIVIKSSDTDPLGYSGIKTNIETKAGLVSEIQVNSPAMIVAKETPEKARGILGDKLYDEIIKRAGVDGGKGHEFYEAWRKLDRRDQAAKDIAKESKLYYSKFQSLDITDLL